MSRLLAALALAGLITTNEGGPQTVLPGQPLQPYLRIDPSIRQTGGLAVPGLKRGFSFQIWEDRGDKEFRYGPTLLPGDPTDQVGYVYLPKTTLLVQRDPGGRQVVVATKETFLVSSNLEVQERTRAEEAIIAAHQPAPKGWRERLSFGWHRQFLREPYFQPVFDDGDMRLLRASAAGQLWELVCIPEFEPVTSPEPGAKASVPPVQGVMKVIRYLRPYEAPALEDLVSFARGRPVRPRNGELRR